MTEVPYRRADGTPLNQHELADILAAHEKWRFGKEGGARANLAGFYLRGANLGGADLGGANLRGADLGGADLRGANLRGADLGDANLRGANLAGFYLRGADLGGADLGGANLRGADLRGANLTPIRDDIWAVLSAAPAEVEGLRKALIEGRVDGSTYQGECACLVGTLAKVRGVGYDAIPALRPNSARPAESFFMAIRRGDTPATSEPARIALAWVDEWLANMRAAFGAQTAA